ncbi:MAG: rod shape-determining protein [Lachnospiraceae bacterium]|nr:rod shape-determining protein [Lachnospiraceae bacterium]
MENVAHEPSDIVIYIQDKGMVLKEKSLVAFDTVSCRVLAYGTEAEGIAREGRKDTVVVSPLRQGMIVDFVVARELFRHLLQKALGKRLFKKPAVAVCVPEGIVEVEKKIMEDVVLLAGAREVMFTDIPVVQFVKEMPEKFPAEYKKYKIVIGITKDEPEEYIKEELGGILQYAAREGISAQRVADLLQSAMEEGNPTAQISE